MTYLNFKLIRAKFVSRQIKTNSDSILYLTNLSSSSKFTETVNCKRFQVFIAVNLFCVIHPRLERSNKIIENMVRMQKNLSFKEIKPIMALLVHN